MATGEHRRAPTYQELVSEFGNKGELALGFERIGDNVIVRAEKLPPEPELEEMEFARIVKTRIAPAAPKTPIRFIRPKMMPKLPIAGPKTPVEFAGAAKFAELQSQIQEMGQRIESLEEQISELRRGMNGKKGKAKPAESSGGFPAIPLLVSKFQGFIRARAEEAERAKFREFQRKLFVLTYDGPQSLAKICEFTGADSGAAGGFLARLREQGLVFERKRRGEPLFGIRR